MILLRFDSSIPVIEVTQIGRILYDCIFMSFGVFGPTVINRKISGIGITVRSLFVVISIRRIFGHVEMNESFAIELARIDTLLAGTDVNVLIFEVEAGDVIDLPSDSLIFR